MKKNDLPSATCLTHGKEAICRVLPEKHMENTKHVLTRDSSNRFARN